MKNTAKSSRWRMIVMKLKNIGTKKNPLAYFDSAAEDFIESVEEFFEDASIEVHYTEVEALLRSLLTMASLIGRMSFSSTSSEISYV